LKTISDRVVPVGIFFSTSRLASVKIVGVTEQKEQTFLYCSCPHCKRPFDYVPVAAYECPFCRKEIRRSEVWQTRRYPGTLMLPGWARAFGWPFLVMLAGVAYFVYSVAVAHSIEIHALLCSAIIFATGLIFFLFKLSNNGES
jgi:hypothetical protein